MGAIDSAYDNATVSAHAGAKFDRFELGAKVYQASGTVDYQNSPTLPVSQDYLDRVLRADLVSQVNELWRTQLVLSRMDNDIEQNDPVSFPPGEMDYLETHRHTVDWQNDLNLGAAHRLTAGVMVASENAVALSFGTQFDQDTDIVNAYIQHQLTEGAHALLLALGYTDYSTFGGEYIWNVEYGYSFSTGTQLIGAAGNGFRAPTATDLYGFGGNPNLLPEQSRSYELTVRQRITDQQSMALTAFQNQIDELIAFDPVTFTVGNIARARTRGIEASYAIRGDDWRLHIEAVYQDPINLDTRQQLLRRAKKSASAGYAQTFGMLEVGFDVLYSGERLDSQFPGFVELEDYVLANLHARLNLGKHWSVIAQVDNLFDTEYQVASGFNSAERGGSVAVRWNLR
jgi:vitamin B12 transporter